MDQGRSERKVLLDHQSSARQAARRPWRYTWIGLGSGLLLLIVVVVLDRTPAQDSALPDAQVVDLIGPSNLDPDDGGSVADMLDPRMSLELPRGGWIQVANDQGRLAQQYRCEHLDPAPPELDAYWIAMDQPEVELYMSGNRLVTLRGDAALAYAPHRALEEGQFNGRVEIAMYEPREGQPADPRTASPDMIIRTPRATFDNFLGKITCDGRIMLETAREEMVGKDLQILLNDEDQRIEYLQMASLEYLLIRPPTPPQRAHRSRHLHLTSWQPPPSDSGERIETPEIYQLTLHGGVRIRQGDGPRARTAIGNEMHVIFSLENEQLNSPSASQDLPPVRTARLPAPIAASMLAVGMSPAANQGDILVTCGGNVTMVPLPDSAIGLQDPRDARLDLLGSPVVIDDPERRVRITCPLAQYHTNSQRFDLRGTEDQEVAVLTDRFEAQGSWMWAQPAEGKAGFIDAGSIDVHSASPLARAVVASQRDPASNVATEPAVAAAPVEMNLTWNGGVDIEFDPDDPEGVSEDPALRSIHFRDDVSVKSEDGTIACGSLKMLFARNQEGQAEPERMVALENVRARNDQQTLWSDQLIVTMEATGATAPNRDDLLGGQVTVKDFLATGDVQVLLADGGRAFADRLEGDARQEVAVLTGDDVTVARKEMLINHGRRLEISRLAGTATWAGPGQARLLREPLDVGDDRRIGRPSVPVAQPAPDQAAQEAVGQGPVTMRARWNQQMVYDSTFNDGAGSIELRGKVAVVADGSPTERSTMDGESLTLQFTFDHESSSPAGRDDPDDPLNLSNLEGGDRLLEKLIAKGDARLERREWSTSSRTDLPRVFYVAAKHITWDDRQVRADVIGDGSMVLREPPLESDRTRTSAGPFAGPGTSRFVWTKQLKMVRRPSDQFDISMFGAVEGLYRGASDAEVATITADRVDALTRRARQATSRSPDGPLDFGGDLEIEQLRAEGSVYLATRQRRADANLIEYDTRTQIATLTARPGRKVSVLTEGSPLPVKASKMVWNMDPQVDSVQLIEPSGTGLR